MAQELNEFLQAKVDLGIITTAKRDEALVAYNNATNIEIVPDAVLRAGIVSLVGTVGEPAIAHYFDGANSTGQPPTVVGFDANLFGPDAVIAETSLRPGNRLRTIFNPDFQGESFINLSAVLAHETTHQDSQTSQNEEVVANIIETMVYAQQLTVDSSVARAGTELATRQNERLAAMINSGDFLFPRVGVAAAPLVAGSDGVLPGSKLLYGGTEQPVSFLQDIYREYTFRNFSLGTTPSNITTAAILSGITGQTLTSANSFSDQTIAIVDETQVVIGDRNAVDLAGVLKLTWL